MRLLLLMLPSLLCAATEPLPTPSRDGYVCPLGQFPCGNLSVCLPQALHCNGVDDCDNGADEENCVDTTGWLGVLGDMLAGNGGTEDEADTCLLEMLPERCRCWGRAVDCTAQNFSAVPRVSPNVTQLRKGQSGLLIFPPVIEVFSLVPNLMSLILLLFGLFFVLWSFFLFLSFSW